MNTPFDIFQLESDGNMLWLEAAATLEDAKTFVQGLVAHGSGEYMILNQGTGNKLVIKPDGMDGTTSGRSIALMRDRP